MNAHTRIFQDAPAVRSHVPLLIGLMGPSGSGKTYSALRLATGIQKVSGGEIFFIDTESKRALHYAENFTFRHIEFGAPFGSLDYLAALQHCVAKGAGVIVVDSVSHEHIGMGGYLLTQEAEIDRMAGDDLGKRERVKMAGWIKPAKLRQQFITGLLQLNSNFIFCFRAKEKTKPVGGKPVEMGFMPIAGEELLFELTLNCLLLPKAGGVPTWRSDHVGERLMMKCPLQFEKLFASQKPIDEDTGRALAEWARGGADALPSASPSALNEILADGDAQAAKGTTALKAWWQNVLTKAQRLAMKDHMPAWKAAAEQADEPDVGFDESAPQEAHGISGNQPDTKSHGKAGNSGDVGAGRREATPFAADAEPLGHPQPKDGGAEESAPPSGRDDDDLAFDILFIKARAKADGGTAVFSRWHSALSDSDRAMLDRVKPGLMAAAAMATKAADRGAA